MPYLLEREQTGEFYYQKENLITTMPGSTELNPSWLARYRYCCPDEVYELYGYINDFDENIVVMTLFFDNDCENVIRMRRNMVNLTDIYRNQPIKLIIIKLTFLPQDFSGAPFKFMFEEIPEELPSPEEIDDEVDKITKNHPDIDWDFYD